MLRSAAKNHERVAVVVDPDDYAAVIAALRARRADRRRSGSQLARKAFAHTAAYDAAIAAYLSSIDDAAADRARRGAGAPRAARHARRAVAPAVRAALRREPAPAGGVLRRRALAAAARRRRAADDRDAPRCSAASSSRTTTSSISTPRSGSASSSPSRPRSSSSTTTRAASAIDRDVAAAYQRAREADATSAFGGIVAVNREVDEALAKLLVETFLECVIAPGYSAAARDVLAGKKNLRLVAARGDWARADRRSSRGRSARSPAARWCRRVDHGMVDLARREGRDHARADRRRARGPRVRVARRQARQVERDRVREGRRHGRDRRRPDEPRRLGADLRAQGGRARSKGAVVASDAFFPFRDGVDVLAAAGAVAVVQPGGSVRDDEVIAAANEHGLAMLFTGMRHFRH